MGKIKLIGDCFIKVEETLYNLKEYSKIERHYFGYDEDPEENSAFGINLTPIMPSEEDLKNGVDGTFFITLYTLEQENDFEEDYEKIITALKD